MEPPVRLFNLPSLLQRPPDGAALLRGRKTQPSILGRVRFWQTKYGVLVMAEVTGLQDEGKPRNAPILGFHIHSGSSCTGSEQDPFSDALTHYNPHGYPHPYHSGDLPPLFVAHGRAVSAFLTDRFTVDEVIGKTVIVHERPDDFTTQPSGNAGERIACGVIRKP